MEVVGYALDASLTPLASLQRKDFGFSQASVVLARASVLVAVWK